MPKLSNEFTIGNLVSIITTFLMVGGLIWHLSASLAALQSADRMIEQRLLKAETQVSTIDREARDFGTRIARIEEKTSSMLTILQRIERFIDGNRRTDLP